MTHKIIKFCKLFDAGLTILFPEYYRGKHTEHLTIDINKISFFIQIRKLSANRRRLSANRTNDISDLLPINNDDTITILYKLRSTVPYADRISIFKNSIRFHDADFNLLKVINI